MAIKVGIAGLDGRLASRVALCLLSSPDVTISGYSCTPSKVLSAISSHPGVTIRDGSAFDLENMRSLVRGCDVVVCGYQGPDDIMLHGQKTLIDACEEESVDRYVASDWTLDYTKLEYGQLWTKEPMKDVMAYIKSKTHVKGVHILNGIFMETFFSPFFNLYDPATRTFSAWGEGFEVWEGTSYESAAKWTAEVVLNKSTMGIIRLVGDSKTLNEIVQIYERIYDAKPDIKKLGSLPNLYEHMHTLRAESPDEWFRYMPMFYTYYMLHEGQTCVGPSLDNQKYPTVKPTTWEDYIKERTIAELIQEYQPRLDRK